MEVSDCVATALTRARQARLPSPWTEAVDFLDLGAQASKKVEHWRARLCGKQRKSTASGQGEGSEVDTETARMFTPLPYPHASGVMFASGYTGVQAMAAL